MSLRRKSRELALQYLYQIEQSGNKDVTIEDMKVHFDVSAKAIPYTQELISGIQKHWEEINSLIEEHAKNWRLNRMAVIDRNILRIATYEFMYQDDIPGSVIIDEAVEISKRFSTDEAPSFINGILDPICKVAEAKKQTDQGVTG
jgi:N utilization substance protein B